METLGKDLPGPGAADGPQARRGASVWCCLGTNPRFPHITALVLGMLSWNSFPEKPCRFLDIWKFSKTSKYSTFPKIWRCLIKAVSTQDRKQGGYDFVSLGFIFVFLMFVFVFLRFIFVFLMFVSIDVIYISIYGVYILFRPVVM